MSLAKRSRGLESYTSPKEIQQGFRNLVTGVFMNDFDYTERPFSFKTVFHITPYSYRCCSCSYEFEYVDYISDTGKINETMFEKLVQSVIDEQCPHVDSANEDYVTDTTIHGIHIVAVLETDEVFQRHYIHRVAPSGIFGISPCHVAVLKGKPKSLQSTLEMYPYTGEDWTISYWYRSEGDQIKIIESSFLELCVRKDNPCLLNTFITWAVEDGHVNMDISKALRFAITHKLSDAQDILLRNLKDIAYRDEGCYRNVIDCAVIAIILNEPKVLENVLDVLSALKSLGDYSLELAELCLRLPRPECTDISEMFDIFCEESEPPEDTVHGLITLLSKYLDGEHDEIVVILKSIPEIETHINSADEKEQTEFNKCLSYTPASFIYDAPTPSPKMVRLLLDLGSDINTPFPDGDTPLKFLLRERADKYSIYYENLRWTAEMLLNENPDFEEQEPVNGGSDSVIKLALKVDTALVSLSCEFGTDHPATMKLDNSVNTYSRHEGARYALNFLVPLLIECGYPVNRDDLLEAESESLEPAEYDYIQRVLDRPRGLILMCRDVLRDHFKGRGIRYYVENIYVPESVKDFILLKQELLMLRE